MLNYIRADFYRIFRKKSFYIFLVFCSLGFISLNFVVSGVGYSLDSYMGLSSILLNFVPIFVGLFVFNAVYTDDLRSKSLQTAIGFGKKRSEIVFVKLIDALLLLMIFMILIAAHIYIVPMLFGLSLTAEAMEFLNVSMFTTFLKTLGYFALSSAAVFYFQKATASTTLFILLSTGTINLIFTLLLGQQFLIDLIGDFTPYLFSTIISNISNYLMIGTGNIVMLSVGFIAYIALGIIVSITAFNHKELEF